MKKVLWFIILVGLLVPLNLYGESDIDPTSGVEEFCLDQPEVESKRDLHICMKNQWAASEVFETKYLIPYEKILNKLPENLKIKDSPPEIQVMFICMMSTKQNDENWPYDFVLLMHCMDSTIKEVKNKHM